MQGKFLISETATCGIDGAHLNRQFNRWVWLSQGGRICCLREEMGSLQERAMSPFANLGESNV
jgi:hypothetical protein